MRFGMMAVLFPTRLKVKFLVAVIFVIVCFFIFAKLTSEGNKYTQVRYNAKTNFKEILGGAEYEDEEEDEEEPEFPQHIERNWKEPDWKIADILRNPKVTKKQAVPVFVVEEHHEGTYVFQNIFSKCQISIYCSCY